MPHAKGDPLDDFMESPPRTPGVNNPASLMESGFASPKDQRPVDHTVHLDESRHFYSSTSGCPSVDGKGPDC